MSAFDALLNPKTATKSKKKSGTSAFDTLLVNNPNLNPKGVDVSGHVVNSYNTTRNQSSTPIPTQGILANVPVLGSLLRKVVPKPKVGMEFPVGSGLTPQQQEAAKTQINREIQIARQPVPQTSYNMDFPGAAKEALRAPLRAAVSIGAIKSTKTDLTEPITAGKISRFLLGDEPITPFGVKTADLESTLKDKGFGKWSTPLAIALTTGQTALDLSPILGIKEAPEKLVSVLESFAKPKSIVEDVASQAPKSAFDTLLEPKVPSVSQTTTVHPFEKVSKAASDINTSLVSKGFTELPPEQLAHFTPITKADQIEKVSNLLETDSRKAIDMASGKERIPNDVHPQVLFNAVKNKAVAEADGATLQELASSPIATERSLAAQTLSASGFDNGIDPIKAMQDISKIRETAAAKRYGNITKAKAEVKQAIKQEIIRTAPKPKDWAAFVDSLKCN